MKIWRGTVLLLLKTHCHCRSFNSNVDGIVPVHRRIILATIEYFTGTTALPVNGFSIDNSHFDFEPTSSTILTISSFNP